jgi:hypothetical protein
MHGGNLPRTKVQPEGASWDAPIHRERMLQPHLVVTDHHECPDGDRPQVRPDSVLFFD